MLVGNPNVRQPRQQTFDRNPCFDPRERRTEATVHAAAETHVIAHAWVGRCRTHPGPLEVARIVVRTGEAYRDNRTGRHVDVADFSLRIVQR